MSIVSGEEEREREPRWTARGGRDVGGEGEEEGGGGTPFPTLLLLLLLLLPPRK